MNFMDPFNRTRVRINFTQAKFFRFFFLIVVRRHTSRSQKPNVYLCKFFFFSPHREKSNTSEIFPFYSFSSSGMRSVFFFLLSRCATFLLVSCFIEYFILPPPAPKAFKKVGVSRYCKYFFYPLLFFILGLFFFLFTTKPRGFHSKTQFFCKGNNRQSRRVSRRIRHFFFGWFRNHKIETNKKVCTFIIRKREYVQRKKFHNRSLVGIVYGTCTPRCAAAYVIRLFFSFFLSPALQFYILVVFEEYVAESCGEEEIFGKCLWGTLDAGRCFNFYHQLLAYSCRTSCNRLFVSCSIKKNHVIQKTNSKE